MSDAPPPPGVDDANNRRIETRAPIALRVEYRRLNSFFADYTRNISRGGTFIKTAQPLDVGTEFRFDLVLPEADSTLSLLGVVRWVVRPDEQSPELETGMGIEFVFQDDMERRQIHVTVETMMKQSLGERLFAKLLGEGT